MCGSQPERVEEVGLLSGLGFSSKHLEVREVQYIHYYRVVKTQPDKIYFRDNVQATKLSKIDKQNKNSKNQIKS